MKVCSALPSAVGAEVQAWIPDAVAVVAVQGPVWLAPGVEFVPGSVFVPVPVQLVVASPVAPHVTDAEPALVLLHPEFVPFDFVRPWKRVQYALFGQAALLFLLVAVG